MLFCCLFLSCMTSLFENCFFFQAEDGIRDSSVTGVQTCALPISVTAAEIRHDDANLIERQMKNLSEMLAQRERFLRAGPKRQPVAFVVGHGRVRLHGKMLHPRKSKSILENMVRLGKAFVDVAFGITEAITEIGA